ncbi:VOC family protein [Corticibacter populi]|uniref:2-oxoadipate dioxygenase/decarboxylase n=1 Tax=Corticibacter populi TaxID=1550736 RepID=A0A3M6QYE9_9BURK|nr:VOC family protein [Corticibacter populi]RMX07951.1 VOC family protein [Corticibacter populi]RZS35192.1 putative glyoxalase superfamily metalloenzyme YdcJ [Corticibacter populi]
MADTVAPAQTVPFVSTDEIRTRFSRAMSDMYRNEVPQYGTLLELVAQVNEACLQARPELRQAMQGSGELERLNLERHGAIRVGTAQELATLRRLFAVMGMEPVGYYDLSVAGVPVHATAFRPVSDEALHSNPFRVFTSLLRLELIADAQLRERAQQILSRRNIFTARALELIAGFEAAGGLSERQADEFVREALETFRWHSEATVDFETYTSLQNAHRLIADVVCFKGPHINHLTPRTLDIDAIQAAMPQRGINAKDVVEGPPRRECPILLRQTSFKALQEPVHFSDHVGSHTARFGEIEQRGVALTRKGRQLYDELLSRVRSMQGAGSSAPDYGQRLAQTFGEFPDSHERMREEGLAFYRYRLTDAGRAHAREALQALDGDPAHGLHALVNRGWATAQPITYEDFLPVSAAGIFQSNLGGQEQRHYQAHAARQTFERDLGAATHDELALYEQAQQRSVEGMVQALQAQVKAQVKAQEKKPQTT